MKNSLHERVADFLMRYPPFDRLKRTDLIGLTQGVTVKYLEKEQLIFNQGDSTHSVFYVVYKGAVAIEQKDPTELIDLCDEGDLFGLRPLVLGPVYQLQARAYEESIVYAIPIELFMPMVHNNPPVADFIWASFQTNTRNPFSESDRGQLYAAEYTIQSGNNIEEPHPLDLQPIAHRGKLVKCSPDTPIVALAKKMRDHKVGSIVVHDKVRPVGIITDKDLRNKICTAEVSLEATAAEIMVSPVYTCLENVTVTHAQMMLVRHRISHLCVTVDGTSQSKAVGVISKDDVLMAIGQNPTLLIKAIMRAENTSTLKKIRVQITHLIQRYLDRKIPTNIIANLITELNDACIKQIIQLQLKKRSEPPVAFAWLSLGSQGRSEQLLQTDQDNALLYQDPPDGREDEVKEYFLSLGKSVTKNLKTIGYEYCPAEMMASNPKWCLSASEWKQNIQHWIQNPGREEVLLSSIFFDYNFTYGNKTLVESLSDEVFEQINLHPVFLAHFALGALQSPPPTGFFRSFIVEQDGTNKDRFDLKRRALMPLIDAARVLILSHGVKDVNNTQRRYEKLAQLEPQNEELYMDCATATKDLIKFRTKQGLAQNNSGRYIELSLLTKEEKIKLKATFQAVKQIQELLKLRFNLTAMM